MNKMYQFEHKIFMKKTRLTYKACPQWYIFGPFYNWLWYQCSKRNEVWCLNKQCYGSVVLVLGSFFPFHQVEYTCYQDFQFVFRHYTLADSFCYSFLSIMQCHQVSLSLGKMTLQKYIWWIHNHLGKSIHYSVLKLNQRWVNRKDLLNCYASIINYRTL